MPLPQINRLSLRLHKDDFSSGQKFYGKFFTVIVGALRAMPLPNPQFAILVSKKTARLATSRNKIRRLTSSVIQNLLPQFPVGQYLIIPKSSVTTTPFSEIESDIVKLIANFSPLSKGDAAKPRGI